MWKDVVDSLTILGKRTDVTRRPLEDARLDEVEKATSCLLPTSYREFMKVLGAGELCDFFQFAAIGKPASRSPGVDTILEVNRRWHEDDEEEARFSNVSVRFMQRMVYFCETAGGEAIGWSNSEVTAHAQHEYAIYVRMKGNVFVRLAENFPDFIRDVCLSSAFDLRLQEHGYVVDRPKTFPRVFRPAKLRF